MKITDSNTTELFEKISDDEAAQVYGGLSWKTVITGLSIVSDIISIGQFGGNAIGSSNGSSAFNGSTTYDALGNVTSSGDR